MIKYISLWLIMGLAFSGYSQVVTVIDAQSGAAIHGAVISSAASASSFTTDVHGQVDVSSLDKVDSVTIEVPGYERITVTYQQLSDDGFIISLNQQVVLLDEAVVSSYTEDVLRKTSLHIEPLQLKSIEEKGTYSLTDALATIPGVSQLSTGPGVSKPVVRGLYGNRVLVLFSGLRFDNQQWQDEHGLGLSDMGIQRVELIKGPLSVLYGTEAVGGVINIIEETAPYEGTSETEVKLSGYSNTGGVNLQVGTNVNKGKTWYRLRAAATNHADYSDGNGDRVLNSRFNGYYLKGSLGFVKNNWRSDNHYSFSYNNFGFIFNDISHFMEVDPRWSRQMSGPHHKVMLNIFSSINRIQLRNSVLNLNVGLQSNYRSEDEGGGELSLQMHLVTGQYALKWNKQLNDYWSLVLANTSSLEVNTNYGRRKIVPDATTVESAVSVYLKYQREKWVMEYGAGGGLRYIKTLETPTVNSTEKDIDPFQQTRTFFNGMIGAGYIPDENWNIKVNVSTGVRAPNLAELSANGLHEGIYTYEIGDPDMKNERNVTSDLGVYYSGPTWQFSASGFYNHFDGYIYLEPTSEDWFGFPVYRFKQHNAAIYGSEYSLSFTPEILKGVKLSATYAQLIGQLDNGEYLPYMPAQKIKPEIRYDYRKGNGKSAYAFVNNEFVLAQNKVNSQENNTPAYSLLNAGIGFSFCRNKANYMLNVAANNLLNEAYYDHLSRLKNYGLLNMGRNVTITLKVNFKNQVKTQTK